MAMSPLLHALVSGFDLVYLALLIQGHSTSNEMMAHALRPRILFNFFSVLPNYTYEQIQNLSFLFQIVFELKLF